MSLIEWIGERYNPGPSGSFRFGRENRPPRTNGIVLLRLCISLAIIVLLYSLVTQGSPFSLKALVIFSCVLLAYCLLSYFICPEPDTSNMGWLGGLMDNPFRFSDDINRFLLFLKLILIPGRFLAESIVDGFFLLQSR